MVFYESINNYFNNLSYTEEYSFDIWFTFIMCLITFIIAFTVFLQNKIKSNKTYFKDNKCNPFLIPFASTLEESDDPLHNAKNMEACINESNFNIGNTFLDTFKLIINSLTAMFTFFVDLFRRFMLFLISIAVLIGEIFARIYGYLERILYALNDVYNDILHALSALGSFITTIFYTLVLFFQVLLQSAWIMVFSWLICAVIPAIFMLILFIFLYIVFKILCILSGLCNPIWGIPFCFLIPTCPLLGVAITGIVISTLILAFMLIIFFILKSFAITIGSGVQEAQAAANSM
tara:strand:+ start:3045 stop:3917 length:873 start_codon:yes stop_codon:yes gene_type:complete